MKASKFSGAQIAFVLKQPKTAWRSPRFVVSQTAFDSWQHKHVGFMPSEMKQLWQLEAENGRLKRLVAELSLDKAMRQDVLSRKALKPGRKRLLVD
ncbi:hypothetical protein PsAD2_01648 [Pseudovibrio axinellae]|uniref:Transposase n=1 Tax=Pseudovibrio axinellae TaxID=989403 RepID=A0A165ZF50_9HYPH|nr:hypothetical protein [Pseudovibrio axinellae]KZL19827.1 hypothetical protein PsAD2_01648 [Pseudovibrio axinellae]SER39893.1 putative transposase [Pseudovibrio axinellae]